MKALIYNQKGEKVGKAELPAEVFEVKMNTDLVHQMVLVQQANRRKKIAKTKDRSERGGGGHKPWRQKGTGRARVGSNRSPIWKGGGITFGPTTEKIFKKKITKKMRRKALFMVLSAKAKDNLLLVLDNLKIDEPRTKVFIEMIKNWKLKIEKFKDGSGLVALPGLDKNVILSLRNIPKIDVIQAKDLNVLDLLSYKYLVMPKESMKVIKETFVKSEK